MLGAGRAARLIASDVPAWVPAGLAAHLGGVVAKTPAVIWISVAAVLICGLGLFDDARPVGAGTKLAGQVAVAVLVVVGCDLRLMSHLGRLPSVALSILWIVTLTNSLTLLDNMSGRGAGASWSHRVGRAPGRNQGPRAGLTPTWAIRRKGGKSATIRKA